MINSGINNLCVIGLSHWKAPLNAREKFSLSNEQTLHLFRVALDKGIISIIPIITCNRIDIYANTHNPHLLAASLCEVTGNEPASFYQYGYIKHGQEAMKHIFSVAAGVDSQLPGDAQIVGQIREAHKLSLAMANLQPELNRLIEAAIATGKKVRTESGYNSGTHSIANAAIKYAVKRKLISENSKILVVGLGKIGRLALKGLLKVIPGKNITLMNRTQFKSEEVSDELGTHYSEYEKLRIEIAKADVIVVATNSEFPIVTESLLRNVDLAGKTFVDLSMPRNVEPGLNANIIDIDQIGYSDSEEKTQYFELADQYVRHGLAEYYEWLSRYQLAQDIKMELHDSIFDNGLDKDVFEGHSKFVEGLTFKYLRHFQKEKQSRNLAA